MTSNPVKILLHMVQIGEDWAGRASDFGRHEEFRFRNLSELTMWLKQRRNKRDRENNGGKAEDHDYEKTVDHETQLNLVNEVRPLLEEAEEPKRKLKETRKQQTTKDRHLEVS